MDEPTSVLTPQEVEQLFETLRKLAAGGCSILYISHKLHEIVALCDTATILRGGKVVAHCDPKRETSRSMAEMMIGANLKEIAKPVKPRLRSAEAFGARLEPPKAERVRRRAARKSRSSVKAGEIFRRRRRCRKWTERTDERDKRRDPRADSQGRSRSWAARSAGSASTSAATLGSVRGSGRAQRPCGGRRILAHRQWRADRSRPHAHGELGPHQSRQGDPLRRRCDRRLHGEGDWPRRARGLALGRQFAEIHHGPRDPAAA